jgi:hypothetical protein
MPFVIIALGALFIFYGPPLARQNSAFFKRTYGFSVPFPSFWGPFYRVMGLVFVLVGVAALVGIGRTAP